MTRSQAFAKIAEENYLHRVSKKQSKIIFVITSSNFHKLW